MTLSEDARRNRDVWTKANAEYTDARAREAWAKEEIDWGMFGVPESELGLHASESAKDHTDYEFVSANWAQKWPSDEIWKARKRA